MAQVKITETILRDAHQSLIATRMTLDDMLPMLEALDACGFHSVNYFSRQFRRHYGYAPSHLGKAGS